jgi:hypothetical protein
MENEAIFELFLSSGFKGPRIQVKTGKYTHESLNPQSLFAANGERNINSIARRKWWMLQE